MVKQATGCVSAKNRLIDGLPRKDRLALLALCEPSDLALAEVLCEPGKALRYAYVPTDSFVSLISLIDGSPGVEVGMIGDEGMLGAQLALGVTKAPLHGLVQGAGSAWRISATDLRRQLARSESLQATLDSYLSVLMVRMATAAACLRFHEIGPRLARWLLMSQDRAHSDQFQVTQEFLAYMLGVRRVGITAAAGALQQRRLVSYRRGDVMVIDRKALRRPLADAMRLIATHTQRRWGSLGATVGLLADLVLLGCLGHRLRSALRNASTTALPNMNCCSSAPPSSH